MASEYLAQYLVQRGNQQFICRGDKLYERMTSTDLFAVQRDGVLYHATKDKLRDSDWLVCMDGDVTKRVSGSKVIPLLLPPPSLLPLVLKVNGTVYEVGSILERTAGTELDLEIEANSATNHLTKNYKWVIRSGNGKFLSSNTARAVAYEVGDSGFENISCEITAIGAAESLVGSEPIQIFVVP